MEISLTDLLFDPQNPRLPKYLIGCQDEQKIIEYFLRYGNIIELMQSIGETGYSEAEPLLVVPSSDNKYIVVEGNRRLAALKLLSNPPLASLRKNLIADIMKSVKYTPALIPVIVYPEREEILDYLGYRHITGVKDWGALEKARYLDQLYNAHIDNTDQGEIYSILAKMIGSRKDYVAKLHTALNLYDLANDNAYYGAEIDEESFNFSWLTTILSYNNFIAFLGLSSAGDSSLDNLKDKEFEQLFTWLFHPNKQIVKDSRQISDLNKILESPDALKKLQEGNSISEAILYTSAPNETFHSLVEKAKYNLLRAKDIIEQLNKFPVDSVSIIKDIEKLCRSINGALREVYPNDSKEKELEALSDEQIQQIKSLLDRQGS